MFTLILLILFSIVIGFFSTQNTVTVPLTLFNQTLPHVPLYIIVLGALLFGIFISWFVSLIDTFFATMTIWGKDSALKSAHHEMQALREENNQLQIENARLQGARDETVDEVHSEDVHHVHGDEHTSVMHRLRHSLNM